MAMATLAAAQQGVAQETIPAEIPRVVVVMGQALEPTLVLMATLALTAAGQAQTQRAGVVTALLKLAALVVVMAVVVVMALGQVGTELEPGAVTALMALVMALALAGAVETAAALVVVMAVDLAGLMVVALMALQEGLATVMVVAAMVAMAMVMECFLA